MKQIAKNVRYTMIAMMLVSTSFAAGQNLNDSDVTFVYTTSYDPGNINNQGPVGKVLLSEVSDEFIIKKKSDATQEAIENLILNKIPSAQISWIKSDICTVIADSSLIIINKEDFLNEDDIVSFRPAYVRTVYKELIDFYPVKQVALYGFTDEIRVRQKYENHEEVDDLIASLGFQFESDPINPGTVRNHKIFVSKEANITVVANTLYESGNFYTSEPVRNIIIRDTDEEPLDKSELDYIYDSGGKKVYLYTIPGQFMISKDSETDQTEIESLLNQYLSKPYIEWKADNRCQVEVDESKVDEAIGILRNNEKIVSANRSYFMLSDYEGMLKSGTGYPNVFNYSQNINISFKNGVEKSVKDSLANAFNLSLVTELEGQGTWVVPKTIEVIEVCRSLFESGYVNWVVPSWLSGFQVVLFSSTTTTSIVKGSKTELDTQYYNLSGQRINAPSGLTIVVTRYSDGSVRTEKRLY